MAEEFRKLNEKGLMEFSAWIKDGGIGLLPLHLLESTKYSTPTEYVFSTELPEFSNRFEFGLHLVELFDHIPAVEIEGDRYFWSTLALIWFDRITEVGSHGNRIIREIVRYVLDLKSRNFRHLVWTPWIVVRQNGDLSKFLLAPVNREINQLAILSETLEQFGNRPALLRNGQIVKLFSELYYDHDKDQLKQGIGSRPPGGPRRAGIIVRQLSLTYDLEGMSEQAISSILPREFERWKVGVTFD